MEEMSTAIQSSPLVGYFLGWEELAVFRAPGVLPHGEGQQHLPGESQAGATVAGQ